MPTERQRREAERRRQLRQLERRREQAARRRRTNLIVSIVGTVVLIAVIATFVIETTKDDSSTAAAKSAASKSAAAAAASSAATASTASTASTAATSSAAKVAAYPCTWTKSGTAAKKVTAPATTRPPRTGTATVTLATTRGAVTLTLDRAAAPCAVASFVSLAQQKYFDATPCHRLTSSAALSVLQCGDPTGTGSGGPGYTFADELTGKEKYTRGVLAMANSGVNTNGSQFFVVYRNSTLPASYTVFGHVSAGLGVIDAVAAKGSTPAQDGKPKESINITHAVVS